MGSRKVQIARKTRETDITLTLDPDEPGAGQVRTGLPFFDHVLASMAFHGRFFLDIKASGDLEVDPHHLVEDVGLVLGQALSAVLAKSAQVRRFAHSVIPMDEALAQVTIDVCGRPTLVWRVRLPARRGPARSISLSFGSSSTGSQARPGSASTWRPGGAATAITWWKRRSRRWESASRNPTLRRTTRCRRRVGSDEGGVLYSRRGNRYLEIVGNVVNS